MSRPWMPLYIGDYRRDTGHLSTLEHGAYFLLIMHYWETGPLPDDEARLARIAGVSIKQFRPLWASLRGFFLQANAEQVSSKCWRHKRLDIEIAKAESIREKRQMAGHKSREITRGRANGTRSFAAAIAQHVDTQSQSHTKPSSSESVAVPEVAVEKRRAAAASESLEEVIRRKGWA